MCTIASKQYCGLNFEYVLLPLLVSEWLLVEKSIVVFSVEWAVKNKNNNINTLFEWPKSKWSTFYIIWQRSTNSLIVVFMAY